VVGQLLDHQGSHLSAPDGLRRVILTCQMKTLIRTTISWREGTMRHI
jgi:hypothetical protein